MEQNLRVRMAEKSDLERWEAFLLDAPRAHILQSTLMADVFQQISFKPLLVLAEENGDIVGGLMSFKWFGNSKNPFLKLFSRLYSYYGPLSLKDDMDGLVEDILRYLDKEMKRQLLMDHRLSTSYPVGNYVLKENGYNPVPFAPRYIFLVNLQQSKDKLWESLESRCRRAIRKAERKGVEIVEETGGEAPRIFHKLHVDTAKRQGISPDPYSFIKSIWSVLTPKRHARFFFAHHQGIPIAGILTMYYKDKVYYYMGASLKDRWDVSSNNLLHWHAMIDGLENGYGVYDLMSCPGADEQNNPEYGLYLFKKSFGGTMVESGAAYTKVLSPRVLRIWDGFLIPAIKKVPFVSEYV